MIRFSPMSSMMKLQRLCSLSSPTDYPESFVKQFASRHFSPPELPLKVRTLFQVHKRVRWDGNWGNEVLNLTTSRTRCWQWVTVQSDFCPSLPSHSVFTVYYFQIKEHIFTFHRASWCIFPGLSSCICRRTREWLYWGPGRVRYRNSEPEIFWLYRPGLRCGECGERYIN